MIDSLIRKILSDDIEYKHIIKNSNAKYTILWGLKRVIKKYLAIIPCFKTFELVVYFKYHKLRPYHWYKLLYNHYIKKEIYISFQSGFGDMLEVYTYFRKAKEKYPKYKVFAVIHHPDFCKFKEMSFCKGSFIDVNGIKIDYVKEFIDTNPVIDDIVYGDCWGDGFLYGHPLILKREFGFAFDKEHFKKEILYLFRDDDIKVGDKYINENRLDKGISIAVHFKTAKEKLYELIQLILEDSSLQDKKINFILFGAVEQNVEELIRKYGRHFVNLSGSYGRGITTRQLIYIASKSTLFLGGRGGFNAIYYLLDIPTINIFDEQGIQEIQNGLWPINLWEENQIKKLYFEWDDTILIYNAINSFYKL